MTLLLCDIEICQNIFGILCLNMISVATGLIQKMCDPVVCM